MISKRLRAMGVAAGVAAAALGIGGPAATRAQDAQAARGATEARNARDAEAPPGASDLQAGAKSPVPVAEPEATRPPPAAPRPEWSNVQKRVRELNERLDKQGRELSARVDEHAREGRAMVEEGLAQMRRELGATLEELAAAVDGAGVGAKGDRRAMPPFAFGPPDARRKGAEPPKPRLRPGAPGAPGEPVEEFSLEMEKTLDTLGEALSRSIREALEQAPVAMRDLRHEIEKETRSPGGPRPPASPAPAPPGARRGKDRAAEPRPKDARTLRQQIEDREAEIRGMRSRLEELEEPNRAAEDATTGGERI